MADEGVFAGASWGDRRVSEWSPWRSDEDASPSKSYVGSCLQRDLHREPQLQSPPLQRDRKPVAEVPTTKLHQQHVGEMRTPNSLASSSVLATKQSAINQKVSAKAARKQTGVDAVALKQTARLTRNEGERRTREPDRGKKVPAYVLARQAKKLEAERKAQGDLLSGNPVADDGEDVASRRKPRAGKGKRGKLANDDHDADTNIDMRAAQGRRGGKSMRILPQQHTNYSHAIELDITSHKGTMQYNKKSESGTHNHATNAFSALGSTSEESDCENLDFEKGDDGYEAQCTVVQPNSKLTGAIDAKELKFTVARRDVGLVRGYGNRNLKCAEALDGVYSVRVEPDGCVALKGKSMSALHAAKRALEVVVRSHTVLHCQNAPLFSYASDYRVLFG